jgi:LuxR family maltose regulon positive regulatory protein
MSRVQQARGNLRRAATACAQIVAQGGQAPILALAHYDLCKLHYEWNDLVAAGEHARQGIELSRRGASPDFVVRGHATLALVQQAQGEPAAARVLLQEASRQLDRPGLTPGARLHYLAHHLAASLAQGDLDQAAFLAEGAPTLEQSGSFPGYLDLALAQARLLLAQGRREAAWDQLATLLERAGRSGWQSIVVQARALQALAAPTPREALLHLREALALAEPEGYVRTFVDLGEPMAEWLSQLGTAPAYASALLPAFPAGTRQHEIPRNPTLWPAQPLVEPLSERELEVLSLLAAGQMRREIAQELSVSVNTVKAHLKGIYGKLDVHDRRAAVAKARELGLLP